MNEETAVRQSEYGSYFSVYEAWARLLPRQLADPFFVCLLDAKNLYNCDRLTWTRIRTRIPYTGASSHGRPGGGARGFLSRE